MNALVLVLAAALLGHAAHANAGKHVRQLLPELDNSIEPDEVASKGGASRKFVTLMSRPPGELAHAPGDTTELTCEAFGAPAPSVHWYKNDAPVYEFDAESNEILDSNPTSVGRVSSTLLVTRAAAQDRYTCLVVAGANTAAATTVVYGIEGADEASERSRLAPLAPRVLVSYRVLLDVIGSRVVLPCRARGHPRPLVSWTWRDANGTLVKRDPRMKVLRSGELVISRLRWADMGEYTCRAANALGAARATTFLYPAKAG